MNWRLTPATCHHHLTGGTWIAAPWLSYCSAIVAQAIAKGGARIIISAPPRHGKTELISIGTSTWVLENFPRKNVILTCYGADLAEQAGRRVRDILQDHKDELTNGRLRRDATKINAFLTESDGYMFSVGLGGAITGRGAHLLVVDDYIKEIKEALSPTYRQYVWDWFVTTARTRLEPGASIIIIATRWHSDDLIGRLLKAQPGRWTNIVFPAIAEADDVIGRKVGDPLFSERFPIEELIVTREDMGSMFFDAMYQQRPVDESRRLANGEWLKRVDLMPNIETMKRIRIWDLAATQDGGDFTVGTHCCYEKPTDRFFIPSVIRRQISPNQIETLVRQTAISDGFSCAIGIEQEPGASGIALCEHYERTVLPEFKVVRIPTVKNKIARAQPFLAAAEASKVYLVTGSWNNEFVKEVDSFPGEYDDQVDTASAGYTYLTGKKAYSATWGAKLGQSGSGPSQAYLKKKPLFTMRGTTWGSR